MNTSLFEKYKAELQEELKIDELTLKEVQLNLPTNRHKWVARLMEQKFELSKLKKLRKEAIDKVIEKITEHEPVTLSDIVLRKKASQHEVIKKIDEEIELCELLIDYLEKVVEKVCKGISYDIRNLVDIIHLETT